MNNIINTIKRKIFLMIGRGIIAAINNSEGTQKIQITALNGETITDIERFQNYGFESYPKTEAEALVNFLNGNRDHGIASVVHDRRYRPTDLTEGDVRVYNWKGNKITFTDTGITIEDVVNSNKVEMTSDEINITGIKINLLGATEAFLNGTTFDNWITTVLIAKYNGHTHGYGPVAPGNQLTAPTGHLSTKIKGE